MLASFLLFSCGTCRYFYVGFVSGTALISSAACSHGIAMEVRSENLGEHGKTKRKVKFKVTLGKKM